MNNSQVGEWVFALLSAGGYTEQVLTQELMSKKPITVNFPFEQAAAIPEMGMSDFYRTRDDTEARATIHQAID